MRGATAARVRRATGADRCAANGRSTDVRSAAAMVAYGRSALGVSNGAEHYSLVVVVFFYSISICGTFYVSTVT